MILNLMDLGRAVKAFRLARKLTQVALASKAGVRREQVLAIERGSNTQLQALLNVINALGLGIELKERVSVEYEKLSDIFKDE